MKKFSWIGAVAVILLSSGLAPSANALHFRHNNAPRIQKAKKNNSPYAYLKPKKQKRPAGYYRSTLTGEMVYGKPPKR